MSRMSKISNEQDKDIITEEKLNTVNGGTEVENDYREPEMIHSEDETVVKDSGGSLYRPS